MSQVASSSETFASLAARRAERPVSRPFAGVIDMILVQEPVPFPFPGSVSRAHADAIWTWVHRDLCPDLISTEAAVNGTLAASDLDVVMPEVLGRMHAALTLATQDADQDRRLRAALGSAEAREALPTVKLSLRNRALLAKAQTFGKTINTMSDDAALGVTLQSMPLQDAALAAVLFHVSVGQVANPTRLVTAVIKLSGSATEATVMRAGFGPLVEAIMAHAQSQLHVLQPMGAFADIDLVCRSLDRYHRLVRSLSGYIEFSRGSRWANLLSGITKHVSDRIEPRLRDVVTDLNLAMRRGRDGSDRLDPDRILAAINGAYLLAAIRDCRDSMALNALFDQAWSQIGQALEIHLQRNLDLIRQSPADPTISSRLDAAIKIAELRFNPEYAETLRRAWASAERRT